MSLKISNKSESEQASGEFDLRPGDITHLVLRFFPRLGFTQQSEDTGELKNRVPDSKEFPAKRRLEAKKPELDCRALSVKVLACPRDIVGSVPDYHNKVSIAVKQVVILLLKGTAFNL